MLTQQFFLREGVSGLSCDDIDRALLQLALDGTVESEQWLAHMLLHKERAELMDNKKISLQEMHIIIM